MATIIPSSKIYNIQNKKIIDNKINEVSVDAYDISKVTQFNVFAHKSTHNISSVTLSAHKEDIGSAHDPLYSCTAAISVALGYTTIPSIEILKKGKNKYINSIYYGKNNNNTPNITIIVKGTRYTGTIKYPFNTPNYTDSAPFSQALPTNFSHSYTPPKGSAAYVTSSIVNEDNVGTITPTEYEDKFVFTDLKILTSAEIFKGHSFTTSGVTDWGGDGCEKYVPQSVDVSINGDIITLNIDDYSLTKNNKQIKGTPFSIERNDFMQKNNSTKEFFPTSETVRIDNSGIPALASFLRNDTSNFWYSNLVVYSKIDRGHGWENTKPTIIKKGVYSETIQLEDGHTFTFRPDDPFYNKCEILKIEQFSDNQIESNALSVLTNYLNGKETAMIKCSVGGYLVADDRGLFVDGTPMRNVASGKRWFTVYIDWGQAPYDMYVDFILDGKKYSTKILKGETYSRDRFDYDYTNYEYEILQVRKDLVFFNIGDIVQPMVYNNNGDIPMSIRSDGSAKQFRVTGNKINYDGMITQELSLQEV